MKKNKLIIKNNLKEIMKQKELTMQKIHNRTGIGKLTLEKIYLNEYQPSLYTAMLLATILDCNVEDIFYFDMEEK